MRARPLLMAPTAALLAVGGLVAAASAANGAPVAGRAPSAASPASVISVTTAAQLKSALAAAGPGDTIQLADGTYNGNFKTTARGSASARITLTGSPKAVLTAGGGYGLHLNGASYWTVKGITVTGGQKGIMMDGADGVVIDSVTVHGLDMEGVHFRKSSRDGLIENSRIYDTGKDGQGMGEGVYVGSAGGLSDKSDNIRIRSNTIGPDVRGENVDIKEGTTGARISGNTFDGSGLSNANYDDSWVDVKGNGVVVENNTGTHTSNDGYQTHTQQQGWGCGAVFRGNKSDLNGAKGSSRLAVNVTNYDASSCKATVYASNTVSGGKGLTNIKVTGGG
ncbi:right-handed parallel beta-helix repeat-containing protein [Streptomyces sp. NPDC050617]|uniref:right-handed parallel beta-helix repeat-containing protein n=1 Tax=Streptomyces sp. NPDC050617 TaxID=3154628 RepID=UPI00342FA3A5